MTPAGEVARMLGERVDQLVIELLPGGIRESGRTWRCGSVAGEAGTSLAVELAGPKRGIWFDHANPEHRGDALDLVRVCLDLAMPEAILWAERWLGIERGEVRTPRRPTSAASAEVVDKPSTWPKTWRNARPIAGTLAETYLGNRGLAFADPHGDVLRFDPRRARLKPGTSDQFEHHPAMLALLRGIRSGEPVAIHNVYLRSDGADRLRDTKGKTTTGPAGGAAIMFGADFEDVTLGLTVCEGPETAISVLMADLSPVWAMVGAGNLAKLPVLGGIETLTVAADTGLRGVQAAREVAARWREAGCDVRTVIPQFDDWAAGRRGTA